MCALVLNFLFSRSFCFLLLSGEGPILFWSRECQSRSQIPPVKSMHGFAVAFPLLQRATGILLFLAGDLCWFRVMIVIGFGKVLFIHHQKWRCDWYFWTYLVSLTFLSCSINRESEGSPMKFPRVREWTMSEWMNSCDFFWGHQTNDELKSPCERG